MKICIFSSPFHPSVGGLQQIAKTLATEFVAANCEVEVVTDTESLDQGDGEFPFRITRTSSYKERYFAFRRADVILFMNFTFAGVPLALLARKPVVLSHHGIYRYSGSVKTRLIELAKRQLTRLFRNISVSQFVAKNIPGKSVVAPNAYDSALFHFLPMTRSRDFVFCGRLVSDKGCDVLIDAYGLILDEYPNATLTIVGDGPERARLEAQVKSMPDGNIRFTGELRNQALLARLQEHACMVIPSLWEEPFGIVALEGVASCDTVISSNRGGLPEAVGECGVLIEPTAENLAGAMRAVLRARETGEILPGQPSEAQRTEHLAKHAPSRVARRYLDVCCSAIIS